MSTPDFLIIANPASGSQAAPDLAMRAAEIIKQRGHSAELKVTTARGDAERWAANAAAQGVKTVVGCGGDGTLQEIAGSLAHSGTAFGILPGGRCNDFAHALGLSKKDSAEKLVDVLTTATPRAIDLGAMGSKRFLTVATLGFDSDVSRFVEARKLWVKGTLSYVYGIARVLPGFNFPRVKLTGEFGVLDGPLLLAATGNGPCYGGAMKIAPHARLDDGTFDICAVGKVSPLAVLSILPRVLSGSHVTHPAVSVLKSKWLDIETPDGTQFICADGETLGQTPCRFEVLPGALKILAPEK